MYVKYNRVLHGPLGDGRKPPLSINFLRKFLIIAKRRGRSEPSASCKFNLQYWETILAHFRRMCVRKCICIISRVNPFDWLTLTSSQNLRATVLVECCNVRNRLAALKNAWDVAVT